jgi:hypothetical protein
VLGQPASFCIKTFDRYANRRDVGGDTFVVRLIRRGSVKLVRNEEDEREKEEEKIREKEMNNKNNEEKSPTPPPSSTPSLTPEQQQQFEDENEDAAERRRDDERKKKKTELSERKRKQAEEWRQLEALLQQHELARGVVWDEGDGTYTATYNIPLDIQQLTKAFETSLNALTVPAHEETTKADATADTTAASQGCEPTEEFSPHGYQLVVTLQDGGMVRDSPFDILLLHEGQSSSERISLLGRATTTTPTLTGGLSGLADAAENAEPTTPRIALQRVAGADHNDSFLSGLKSDDDGDDREDEETEAAEENSSNSTKGLLSRITQRSRTLSSLAKPTTITTPPSFSPPTSPRPAPIGIVSAPSSPFSFTSTSSTHASTNPTPTSLLPPTNLFGSTPPALPAPVLPIPLPMPTLPQGQLPFVPISPGNPFSTEIFSTMFTAHMELMQPDTSTFSFSPSVTPTSFSPASTVLPPPSFSLPSTPIPLALSPASPSPLPWSASASPLSTTTTTTATTTTPLPFSFSSPSPMPSTTPASLLFSATTTSPHLGQPTHAATYPFGGAAPAAAAAPPLPWWGAAPSSDSPSSDEEDDDQLATIGGKKSRGK